MSRTKSETDALLAQIRSGEPWVFRRSYRSLIPELLILVLLIFGAFYLTASYPFLSQRVDLFFTKSLSLPALIPIVFLGYIIHTLGNSRYLITADRVRATHGVLALEKDDNEIFARDIRGIEVHRPFLGRILNYGNMEIGTSAHQGEEIEMIGVYDPSSIREIMMKCKEFATSQISTHSSATRGD